MKPSRRKIALTCAVAPIAVVLSACSQGSFTASGVIVNSDDNYTCELSGDQLVIMDAEGKDLALGNLGEGDITDTLECTYTFEVSNVESGHDVYQMTIGGRDAPRQTEEELSSGISLTLG